MALTKIGAIIELEGANNFTSQMKSILGYAKDLKREMDVLTSSFDKDAKSVKNLAEQKEVLARMVQNTKDKLKEQENALKLVNSQTSNNALMTKEQAQQYEGLQRDIANTTIEYNKLLQQQRELAQDNSLTLFVDAWKNASSKTGEALKTIGEGMTKAFTLPIVGAGVVATKEFTSLQSAFTGVRKTVKGSEEELEALRIELSKIPLETASTTESVYAVAEAAGQLNVGIKDIPKFTKNIIMLADSTNILADEGAVNIAQFLNIMGESPKTIDQFGNALVELGNTTATDEASILRLATRLASAGKLVGLTTPEILGLSAAMSAVGLTAEAGGTAMSTTMKMISKDVATGGENLKLYAEITGQTAEEFAETWRNEPIKALQDFLVGMSNLEGGSEAVIQMLDELGFSGIRQSDTLQRLTLDYDGLEKAVKSANDEYYNGTALTDEASRRYEDFATSVSQLKEAFKQFMAEIGYDLIDVIQPVVKGLADTMKDLTTWWKDLDKPMKNAILGFLTFAASIGPLLLGLGSIINFAAKVKTSLGVLGLAKTGAEVGELTATITGTGGLTGALSSVGSFLSGPAGLIALLGGMGIAGYNSGKKLEEMSITSEAALESTARKFHWTEEQLNKYGYSWGKNREIIKLATDDMVMDVEEMKQEIRNKTNETSTENQNIFTTFGEQIKAKFTEIKDSAIALWDALKQGVSSNQSQLQIDVKNKMEQMKNEARNKTNQMKNDVSNNFTNMKNNATNSAVKMGNNVATSIRNATPNVQSASYQLVSTGVDRPLNSISGSAYTWGSHIGRQFAAGISSMISRVASAASSLASRVRSYIGFSEPELGPLSDFHTYMPDMIELMVKGINDNAYKVDNAISNLASGMASGVNNNNNYGGITINLNVPQGTNGYQLVDQIETEITNRTIRRRMVFN